MSLHDLTAQILQFRDARDWKQFHTPRHVAAALAIEAAELQEVLLWKTDDEVAELAATKPGHGQLSDEVADVLIYALLFAEAVGIDPEAAVTVKLARNAERYPVDETWGRPRRTDSPQS